MCSYLFEICAGKIAYSTIHVLLRMGSDIWDLPDHKYAGDDKRSSENIMCNEIQDCLGQVDYLDISSVLSTFSYNSLPQTLCVFKHSEVCRKQVHRQVHSCSCFCLAKCGQGFEICARAARQLWKPQSAFINIADDPLLSILNYEINNPCYYAATYLLLHRL